MLRSSPGGPFGCREGEDECSAFANATAYLDGAAVLLDDPIDQRKADAAALRLGREERLEDVGKISVRDALARVRDRDLEPSSTLAERSRSHPEFPAIGHGLHGVETEVPDGLAEPLRVGASGERIAVLPGDLQVRGQGAMLDQQEDLVEDLRHVDVERNHRRWTGILQEVSHDLIETGRLSQHDLDELAP